MLHVTAAHRTPPLPTRRLVSARPTAHHIACRPLGVSPTRLPIRHALAWLIQTTGDVVRRTCGRRSVHLAMRCCSTLFCPTAPRPTPRSNQHLVSSSCSASQTEPVRSHLVVCLQAQASIATKANIILGSFDCLRGYVPPVRSPFGSQLHT